MDQSETFLQESLTEPMRSIFQSENFKEKRSGDWMRDDGNIRHHVTESPISPLGLNRRESDCVVVFEFSFFSQQSKMKKRPLLTCFKISSWAMDK
jgi:hypothetical protein